MKTSSNYGLKLMEGTDNVKRQDFVDNFTKIDSTMKTIADSGFPLVNATGTNAYTGSNTDIKNLTKGTKFTLFVGADANGNCNLNLNSWGVKSIKDSFGNIVTNLKKDIPYNICYNGTDFILQGKGGGGNVQPSEVLNGKTFTNDKGPGVGTMPNNNNKTVDWCHFENITVQPHPSDSSQGLVTIPMAVAPEINSGYYGSGSKIQANIASLNASNIKAGIKVGRSDGSSANCITGTFTSDATAQAGHILSGQSAYVNGNKINGNMPNLAGQTVYGGAEGVKTVQIYPSNTGFLQVINTPSPNSKPYGYIDYTTKLENHIPLNILASALGITANKIISGQEIAGVWGNATPLNFTSGRIALPLTGGHYHEGTFNIPFVPRFVVITNNETLTLKDELIWHDGSVLGSFAGGWRKAQYDATKFEKVKTTNPNISVSGTTVTYGVQKAAYQTTGTGFTYIAISW